MTRAQRKGILNGIWLCLPCSRKIDLDVARYTVEVLREWKTEAEKRADEELGKQLPDEAYATNLLMSAMSGAPVVFAPSYIDNVCQSQARSLELLDPRFEVSVSYQNSHTAFLVKAKEPVDCRIEVQRDFLVDFNEKIRRLCSHGEAFEVDSEVVTLSGSKLIERLSSSSGETKIRFAPNLKVPAVQKIWFQSPNSHNLFILNDFVGEVTAGKEYFSFNGSAYDGILEFSYSVPFAAIKDGVSELKFNINTDMTKWDGMAIEALKHFDAIYKYYSCFADKWQMYTSLEADGRLVFSGNHGSRSDSSSSAFREAYLACRYISFARVILAHLGLSAIFDSKCQINPKVYQQLYNVHSSLVGNNRQKLNNPSSMRMTADATASNIKQILDIKEPTSVQVVQTVGDVIQLYNEVITLPRLCYTLTMVKPRFKVPLVKVKSGQVVQVNWIPTSLSEQIVTIVSSEY